MIMLKYIGNSCFEGQVNLTNVGTAPHVEIVCEYRTCKYIEASSMYDAACRYIEQFANGREVTYDIERAMISDADANGVRYINSVVLQIKIK